MGDVEMTTGHDNTGGSVGNGGGDSSQARRDNTVSEQAGDNTESSDNLPPGSAPSGVGPYLPAGVQPNFSGATAPPLEIPQYDFQPDPNQPPPPSYEEAVAVE
ncbi:Hypp6998 [Branchiostoma lanceolatum]|uniref:Hypp6998 protein n=1 Tax=Branchiostoma lanceolatum TaxID=7740 RepID=A0A8J9YW80_BRALA|nr:Hypp6998 [Branchiostoma lanceolatum]